MACPLKGSPVCCHWGPESVTSYSPTPPVAEGHWSYCWKDLTPAGNLQINKSTSIKPILRWFFYIMQMYSYFFKLILAGDMFDNTSRMGILFFLWCINQPILCLKDGFCFCVLWTSTTYRVWPCSLSFLLTGCSPDGAFSVLHTRRVPHWEQSEPSHYEKDSVWTAKKIFVAKTAWQTSWTVNTFDNEI